jgi:hypothetical protein
MNPNSWLKGNSRIFSTEAAERIGKELARTTEPLLQTLVAGNRIQRLGDGEAVLGAMAKQAQEVVKREYPHLADRVLDAKPVIRSRIGIGDVWSVGVQLGDENASLFKSVEAAENAAKSQFGFKEGTYTTGQRGAGYYVQVTKPVDETDPFIRALPIETENETPRSLFGSLFSRVRTPEDTLSVGARQDRLLSTYGVGELQALIRPAAKHIADLPKKSRNNLRDFLEADRNFSSIVQKENGAQEQVEGRFAQSLSEFGERWHETFGHDPTEAEATAYYEAVRLNDLDWAFRNFRVFRDKYRLGMELVDFKPGPGFTYDGIEAKSVDKVDWDKEAGVLVMREGDMPLFFRTNEQGRTFGEGVPTQKDYVEKLQGEGYRLFQVSPFGDKALKASKNNAYLAEAGVGDEKIHYVLSRNQDIRPLPLNQLEYKPGLHRLYTDGFYVAQPKITRLNRAGELVHRYDYDTNIMMFTNGAKAEKYAKVFENIRMMLKRGENPDEYIKANLPKEPGDIRSLFEAKYNDAGQKIADAPLSLEDPISSRATGTNIGDKVELGKMYPGFRKSSDDPLNLYQDLNKDYIGGRDPVIETIQETGSMNNPILKSVPAKMIDAYSTLNRGVADMLQARFIDDYKIKSIENWIKEFGHTLKVDHPEQLMRNPTRHLFNPDWNTNVNATDLVAAKTSLMALRQFLGTSTDFSKNLRWVKQRMLDSVYNTYGDKTAELASNWLLSTTTDPLKYMRSVAFHTNLGLFNPVQLFLQGQTFFHMSAIAGPTIAAKAAPAAWFMRALRFTDDENIINKFAGMASKFGMKEADFKEAYAALRKSGMDRVGAEVGMRDDMLDPQLISTKLGKFAEWSPVFFNEGERFVRSSGYIAAYLEWRGANPIAKLTEKVEAQILQRADLFSGNMSRASNASWQKGFASIPTQFFAYQFRIMEQLLGKRLGPTPQARALTRARILGMYSLIYGMPVAAGATTAVWPWTDTIRQTLIDKGINYDENVLTRGLVDGFASVLVEGATGNKYNVGQRYGPGGLTALKDWISGDKSGAALLLGVSGANIGAMAHSFWPVLGDVADMVSGKTAGSLLVEDMADFTREISSANNAFKTIYALNYGKLISKNEINLSDVDKTSALIVSLAGLQPQELEDAFLKKNILANMKDAQKAASKEAVKWIRRALRSDDPQTREQYKTRAQLEIEGTDMTFDQRAAVFAEAMKDSDTFVSKIDRDFAMSTPDRIDQFIAKKKE